MRIPIFFVWICLLACSAGTADNSLVQKNWPDRLTLINTFRDLDSAIIIYGKEDYLLAETLLAGIANMQTGNDRFKVLLKRDDEITEFELKKFPLYIIGTQKNLLIKRLDENLPINFTERGFIFDGKEYNDPSAIIKLSFYPNLFNPQLPLTVIGANEEENLVEFFKVQLAQSWGYFFWDSWGYQIFEKNKRVVLGNFSEDKNTLWSLDKKLHWQFSYDGTLLHENNYVTFLSHTSDINHELLDVLDKKIVADINSLEEFAGKKMSKKINYHIYRSAEEKAFMQNSADQANIDFEGAALHTVITNEYQYKYSEAAAQLVCRDLFGEAKIAALETGLAIKFTSNWLGTNYHKHAQDLLRAELLPTIEQLIQNETFYSASDYLMRISAASFSDFLVTHFGRNDFITKYKQWTAGSNELTDLTTAWHQYILTQKISNTTNEISKPIDEKMLLGFNFAHEGYQIYNGYMGSEAVNSIQHMQSIGVNSITIIPYSGFRSLIEPAPIRFSNGPGTENDASIIHSVYTAQQAGMSVMIKPQLWSRLGWTGDITMKSEKDWNLFFHYYEQWILHYALMSEIFGAELFCIGNEFQNASLSHHNNWDELFERMRILYSGKITYAANWGAEFETVTFWDKLDYVAVNCYYPLSDKTDPTDAELLDAFEKNLDIIESVHKKYNLPVLFTEIGFKSIAYPWINPHKDADEQDYNEEAQKRCYTIMHLAMQDEAWIKGIYLWKWPSYLQYAREYDKDFTPSGKAAELFVKDWFSN